MRRTAGLICSAIAVAAIGLGGAIAVGPLAYSEPSPGDTDGGGLTPSIPGIGYPDGQGGGGYTPTGPTFNKPKTSIDGQTVVVRRPEIPDTPPPVVIPVTPVYVPDPVTIPRVPVDIPVIVDTPAPSPVPIPVAVPLPPPPVAIPVAPPPAAPPVPAVASPQVLLTSSAEPGTQALTVILMFTVVGAWIYGHRIVSHWTLARKTDEPTTA
jgi:hypothetical protein